METKPYSSTLLRVLVPLLEVKKGVFVMLLEAMLSGDLNDSDLEQEKFSWTLGPCVVDIDEPCNDERIKFFLYTTKTGSVPINISLTDSRPPPEYDSTASTKLIIHGYAGNRDANGTVYIRDAYLSHGNFNIIVVDWSQLVKLPCYPTAVLNTLQAGKCTAKMLSHLIKLRINGFQPEQIHAIGFSLGAHVAAYASNSLQREFGISFKRITGLDPALPFFASLKNSWKLDKDDARFVDVIHTNTGVFGKIEATGHVDFYVNGGVLQPACKQANNVPLCSHMIAPVYFAESVDPECPGFWGTPCLSYFHYIVGWCQTAGSLTLMGDPCDFRSRGVYYVETRSYPPFALGK